MNPHRLVRANKFFQATGRKIFRYLCLCVLLSLLVFGLYYTGTTDAQQRDENGPSAVFTVTNINDSGAGSFRQAIIDANNTAGSDTIAFNIPGAGVKTISPTTSFPTITSPVIIDGTTQPGFSTSPLIELNGTALGFSATGLNITAGNTTIRGLIINHFDSFAIHCTLNGNNVFEGNYLGTNAAGTAGPGGSLGSAAVGIYIESGNNSRAGGTLPSQRNLISGNQVGIEINNSSGNIIQGNYIGTNINGTASVANTLSDLLISGTNNIIGGTASGARNLISGGGIGITGSSNQVLGNLIGTDFSGLSAIQINGCALSIYNGATLNIVGGTVVGSRNVIAGSRLCGISIGDATGNLIQGNYIGVAANGTTALPNMSAGFFISGTASGNVIGGTTASSANVIANNGSDGVSVFSPAVGNSILGNSIYSNGSTANDLGIDLGPNGVTPNDIGDADTGANNLQNFPILTSAASIGGGNATIQGTLNSISNTTFRIEFFGNDVCDASGNGEGRNYLGFTNVTTDGSGNAAISSTISTPPSFGIITSTATRLAAGVPTDTSEFSACFYSGGTFQFSNPFAGGSPFFFGAENQGIVQVTVTRTGGNVGFVNVNYQTFDGSAVAPQDYTQTGGILLWNDGDSSPKTFNVQITNDAVPEPQENLNLVLFPPSPPATLGPPNTSNAPLFITDDDTVMSVSVSPSSVLEDGAGVLTYTFTRNSTIAGSQTLFFSLTGTASPATDYTVSNAASFNPATGNGSATFPAGATTTTVVVDPTADTVVEPDETVTANISPGSYQIGAPSSATGTITNDDLSATVSVSVSPAAVLEDGGVSLVYTFTRTGGTSGPLAVNFAKSGTTDNADFVLFNATSYDTTANIGTVIISSGITTTTVTVRPTADTLVEPDETVILTVTAGSGYNAIPPPATGTILNDDSAVCPSVPISYGKSVSGVLDGSSCLIGGNMTDLYTFSGTAGDQIVVGMTSDDFRTGITLISPVGAVLPSVEGVTSPDTRLPVSGYYTLLTNGTYTIRAIAPSVAQSPLSGGAYRLTLNRAPAAPCTYSFVPQTNVPSAGGAFSLYVVTQPGCPQAPDPSTAANIYSGLRYRGGRVSFNVSANPNAAGRLGSILIAGQTHTINQFGAAPPTNDNFANAQTLDGLNSPPDAPIVGYNTSATAEFGEPAHAGLPAAKSVWYKFSPPANLPPPANGSGLFSFTTTGSSFDTRMAVYACPSPANCTIGNIIPVRSNDDTTSFDKTSKVTFRAVVGTQYMIAVDGVGVGPAATSGTINIAWIQYERLYRLYLQNYNGFASAFVPDTIKASNDNFATFRTPLKLSLGVYEFNVPADNTIYKLNISGPNGIAFVPNNFDLVDNLTGSVRQGQNNVAFATNTTPRHYTGVIRSITAAEVGRLKVITSYSRGGAGAHVPEDCDPPSFVTPPFKTFSDAQFICTVQPGSDLYDFVPSYRRVPNQLGKKFLDPVKSYNTALDDDNFPGDFVHPDFFASDAATADLTGHVSLGGQGTNVNLSYTTTSKGVSYPITLPTTTQGDPDSGFYIFPDLAPAKLDLTPIIYSVRASRPFYVFNSPPDTTIQGAGTDVPITGTACTYDPGNVPMVSANAAPSETTIPLEITITTNMSTCEWVATPPNPGVSWLSVNSGGIVGSSNPTSPAAVQLTLMPNTGPARSSQIQISGRAAPIIIQQAGAGSPTPRVVRIVDSSGTVGGTVTVPVEFVAQGNEGGVSFTLNFDQTKLSSPVVVAGTNAPGQTLVVNPTQISQGRVGIGLGQPLGFPAGTTQLVRVTFNVISNTATTSQLTFGNTPINSEVGDLNGNVTTSIFIPGTITIASASGSGIEGDINRTALGVAGTGDGDVNVGDQLQYQRFLSGRDCPGISPNEQQRLDAGPRTTGGDGVLGGADGTAIDAYARHDSATDFDPNTTGWQPTPAGGPTGITNLGCTPGPDPAAAAVAEAVVGESADRTVRLIPGTVNNGEVTVEVELNAVGNEAGTQFGIHFDPTVVSLSDVSGVNANSDITPGTDAPAGTTLNVNAAGAANGNIGIVENFNGASDSITAIPAGARRIARVRFHVLPGAASGESKVTFDDSVISGVTADTNGLILAAAYDQNGRIIIPAAASVAVSGRVTTGDGRGVRNATVTIVDRSGFTRTVTTSSFGYYRFDDIAKGTYAVKVSSRLRHFTQRILEVADSLTDIDFVGLE